MLKKASLILVLLAITGCTREVYLQQVPCADCEPCPKCRDLTPECCPELAMQREIQLYEVYEPVVTPCQPACITTPCANTVTTVTTTRSNCRTVCRQRKIEE